MVKSCLLRVFSSVFKLLILIEIIFSLLLTYGLYSKQSQIIDYDTIDKILLQLSPSTVDIRDLFENQKAYNIGG